MAGPILPPDCAYTEHPFSHKVVAAFAKGCGGRLVPVEEAGPRIACYGVLRGCMEAMQAADEFWYCDHGYFRRSTSPKAHDGYYRVVRNGFWHGCEADDDWTRFNKLGVQLKDWRRSGSHIVIVPPSMHAVKHHGLPGWLDGTVTEIRRHTDRPCIVHTKATRQPLADALKNAWCVVTDHSNAAIDALVEGVPAIMTNPARRLGSIADVESPPCRRDFFGHLANGQWTLDEMRSGECWSRLIADTASGSARTTNTTP